MPPVDPAPLPTIQDLIDVLAPVVCACESGHPSEGGPGPDADCPTARAAADAVLGLLDPVPSQRPESPMRECQGCGTIWYDHDPRNPEHHYPWCPIG